MTTHGDSEFTAQFRRDGCFVDSGVLDAGLVRTAKAELQRAIEAEGALRARLPGCEPRQVAFCPFYSRVFLELLKGSVFDRINSLLGRDSILYSYNNSSLGAGSGNFSTRVHRERNYDTGDHLESLGALVLLDDFTAHNGATWFLPGSHRSLEMPDDAGFYARARRLIAPAGSVFYFHPLLVHAGGVNHGDRQRDALAVGFCRSYLRQRLDMVAILGERLADIDDREILQKVGMQARAPGSLEEFYERGRAMARP